MKHPQETMTMYAITGSLTHHTTDIYGISVDKIVELPTFYLDNVTDEQHAEQVARAIICPVDLQYESVTLNIRVEKTSP